MRAAETVSWGDLEAMVDALRDAYPKVDPRALDDAGMRELAAKLAAFDSSGGEGSAADLEAARAMWHWGV
jgi:FeS assembly protein IscX